MRTIDLTKPTPFVIECYSTMLNIDKVRQELNK